MCQNGKKCPEEMTNIVILHNVKKSNNLAVAEVYKKGTWHKEVQTQLSKFSGHI